MLHLRRNNLTTWSLLPWHLHKMMALSSQWCSSHHTQDQRAIMLWACLQLVNASKNCLQSLSFLSICHRGVSEFPLYSSCNFPKTMLCSGDCHVQYLRIQQWNHVTRSIPGWWNVVSFSQEPELPRELSPADSPREQWLLAPPQCAACGNNDLGSHNREETGCKDVHECMWMQGRGSKMRKRQMDETSI